MSLEESQRQYLVEREMEKANVILAEAEDMVKLQHWSGAASRLYYAVFHAVCALLIKDGHAVRSHKGAGIAFRQHYVHAHILPKEFWQIFGQLETLREESDYNCFYDVSEDEVLLRLAPAKEMIATIGEKLQNIQERK